MTKQLDNTTALWAIDVLCRYAPESVGGVAEPQRRYASDPAADYHVECFKRLCAQDKAARAMTSGLCHCGCGQTTSIAHQSNTRLGHVRGQPVRFVPGHAIRVSQPRTRDPDVCAYADCERASTSLRGKISYCSMHFRFAQMRALASNRGLTIPSVLELESLVPADMRCPHCQRTMNWHARDGRSTVVSLQHDRSGAHRLICLGCNSRHASKPGDLYYEIPRGHFYCSSCKKIKLLAEFWTRANGRAITPCRECQQNTRREDARREPSDAEAFFLEQQCPSDRYFGR